MDMETSGADVRGGVVGRCYVEEVRGADPEAWGARSWGG